MAKVREIRRRIRSIEKTRQITKTMEMVATSKLKRATDRLHATQPYAEALAALVGRLAAEPELAERIPLLRRPTETRTAAVLLLTSNRGLAGAFNANLVREARTLLERLRTRGTRVELHVVGRKGINFFRFRREPLASARTDIGDRPTLEQAASLADPLAHAFRAGTLDAVYVVYAQFRSALSTPAAVFRLLPLELPERDRRAMATTLLSPPAEEILARTLPLYLRDRVYRALVETAAAEQGARRTAMKNASDNAGEMLEALRRRYNRERQAAITQEIAEIVSGAAALE